MNQVVQEQSSIPIYRYKFSEEFMNTLANFANSHRYDDAGVFKERWDRWTANDQNISEIIKEEKRLSTLGYDGDMEDKMYKTVRYYLKNKSLEKKEPKKRRKYISIDRIIISEMDNHINDEALPNLMKPSVAYNNFTSQSEYSNLMDKEINRLGDLGMEEKPALDKIKKTYKNRYYLQQKG